MIAILQLVVRTIGTFHLGILCVENFVSCSYVDIQKIHKTLMADFVLPVGA